ncbi:sugar phosphate isomerase/epimerase [Candidatus Poribacteria bacterium]|nr:sugar phosphate isomerase/epimerase [Candidatus Poribacteria bacterium]MYG06180.1 sugar phosphate isomerase/epimerase [Candidatus Poribacteria bacterium]MYK24276.1 sugar phosphate isomerase/epimerase [Candidatus Poribacteria bacterium]
MFKLGTITDGISRDFEYALDTMVATGLEYVELQYLWEKQVGDLTDADIERVRGLIAARNLKVSCISHHNLSALPVDTAVVAPAYREHITTLQRCIDVAQALGTNLVRIFSFRKEMVLFGAEPVISEGAWTTLMNRLEEPLQIADAAGITLVMETAISGNVTSAFLARKLIDALDVPHLKVLWDPCSSLYCTEVPYPNGYEVIREHIAHVHLKDGVVNLPAATFDFCAMRQGQMDPYYNDIVEALKRDGYAGAISLESVYTPVGGTREDGFRESLPVFMELMGR